MGLRETKKERTRQALIDAAAELFERRGYDRTTVADIAAAADISTRTFFSYFASKEELVFPEADDRVRAVVEAIASRGELDGPADVLMRALHNVHEASGEILSPLAVLRIRLIQTVPAVRGRAMRVQLDAQREIAGHLLAAFPDDLDEVDAAALVGAFVGAISGALQVLLTGDHDAATTRERLREATVKALRPWMRSRSD
ncbi:MAG TPA: TetR/AcrR family transcriptional regulator [Candidatus Limnocylindrales bacterium]|nr:TetR/AcrR family transcriptional regulator [Candidatus Limnocylindrales bacterium]